MADYDLDELRALRRQAGDALARAEAAVSDLRNSHVSMSSALDRLLNDAQSRDDSRSRERAGDRMKSVVRILRESGGQAGGEWIRFELIADEFPDVSSSDLAKSLARGREWLWEQRGDTYRMMPLSPALEAKISG
jgi:hypothetical protein